MKNCGWVKLNNLNYPTIEVRNGTTIKINEVGIESGKNSGTALKIDNVNFIINEGTIIGGMGEAKNKDSGEIGGILIELKITDKKYKFIFIKGRTERWKRWKCR